MNGKMLFSSRSQFFGVLMLRTSRMWLRTPSPLPFLIILVVGMLNSGPIVPSWHTATPIYNDVVDLDRRAVLTGR